MKRYECAQRWDHEGSGGGGARWCDWARCRDGGAGSMGVRGKCGAVCVFRTKRFMFVNRECSWQSVHTCHDWGEELGYWMLRRRSYWTFVAEWAERAYILARKVKVKKSECAWRKISVWDRWRRRRRNGQLWLTGEVTWVFSTNTGHMNEEKGARWQPPRGAPVKWYSTILHSEVIRTDVINWPIPPTHSGQTPAMGPEIA